MTSFEETVSWDVVPAMESSRANWYGVEADENNETVCQIVTGIIWDEESDGENEEESETHL